MPRRRMREPYRQMSEFERGRIIGMRECDASIQEIAARVGRSVSAVQRVCTEWFTEGRRTRRDGSGRTTQTTPREDRHLIRMALQDRSASSSALAQQWNSVTHRSLSGVTVRRRLLRCGLPARRPLLRLPLTNVHKHARLQWCMERRHWGQEWQQIVFSDESRFCLFENDGRILVRRRQGERHHIDCIRTRHTAPTQGLMVWGAIGYNHKSQLVRVQGTVTSLTYVNDILRPVAIPFLHDTPDAIFQQDNARPHVAARTRAFLLSQDVRLLPWPTRSPDLSPIENVWDMVKRRVRRCDPMPTTKDELWNQVNAAWMAIPQDAIRTLYASMPSRMEQVISAHGGPSAY